MKMNKDTLMKEMLFWRERAQEAGTCDFTEQSIAGASSNAMLRYACGMDEKPTDAPWDEADWGRCEKAILKIPSTEWLDRLYDLPEMKGWKQWENKIIVAVSMRQIELRKNNGGIK
jgi:hypothetical protein